MRHVVPVDEEEACIRGWGGGMYREWEKGPVLTVQEREKGPVLTVLREEEKRRPLRRVETSPLPGV